MDNSLSPHELKVKFLSDLNFLTSAQILPLIPLHLNLRELNDLNALKETINLTDKLYSALENLYLTGENAYPIVSNHINELIPKIKINKEKILTYLNNYKISHDETGENLFVVDVIKMQKVKPRGFESSEYPDLEIVCRYQMFEILYKQLDDLLRNLKSLGDQTGKKSVSVLMDILDLKELFKSENDFNNILKRAKELSYLEYDSNEGFYKWLAGAEYLAAFAYRLKEKHHLKETYDIDNGQFLRRTFCTFFHIETIDKTFQKNRINEIKKRKLSFIAEFVP